MASAWDSGWNSERPVRQRPRVLTVLRRFPLSGRYNRRFFPHGIRIMEAEQLNGILNHLDDLAARAGELRRYL
ncbi:MAG: hypothetical protein LBJ59_08520 [Zoogloeaceae bacterium]|nr:hypothetical protein [Zoogloeaceae bacterium]